MSADWQDDALCAEVGLEPFFAEKGGRVPLAKRVCRRCDVRAECLADALEMEASPEHAGRHGIWGGLSPDERDALADPLERAS